MQVENTTACAPETRLSGYEAPLLQPDCGNTGRPAIGQRRIKTYLLLFFEETRLELPVDCFLWLGYKTRRQSGQIAPIAHDARLGKTTLSIWTETNNIGIDSYQKFGTSRSCLCSLDWRCGSG